MTIETEITGFWDATADAFDAAPDHGLLDASVRAAWEGRLRGWLPDEPSDVLDLGCGTGSLALLAARQGHRVTALDVSPRMAEQARAKLADTGAAVLVGDAADPPLEPGSLDVVLARHLLWTLPDPPRALRRWARLLRPGGRLVLVEGRWDNVGPYISGAHELPWNGGVSADRLAEAVAPWAARTRTDPLRDAALWGREIADERYAMLVWPAADGGAQG